jgi:malate dehydrogenase (oxaloacetate-decarboxylating)
MFQRSIRTAITLTGEIASAATARGVDVLRDPALNKGAAFTTDERTALGLHGLLPPSRPMTLGDQVQRCYGVYSSYPTDLQKHMYLWQLHDENLTLFYALLEAHLLEMLPVVYDPTVGDAIEQYS